jgi:hypothetical protein
MFAHVVLFPGRIQPFARLRLSCFLLTLAWASCANASPHAPAQEPAHISIPALSGRLQIGDVVFIRVKSLPFRKIAEDTGSWTNHVGIVTGYSGGEYLVGESTFPFSRTIPLSRFLARSENGRFAVSRLNAAITPQERSNIEKAARKRSGIFYDTGFDLHSKRQFCSRYVHEVLYEAKGVKVGDVTTLQAILKDNPNADIAFWRMWYFGQIPWQRKTITPASMLNSPELHRVFDGYADTPA